MKRKPEHASAGFNLLEALILIAVMAALVAVLMPRWLQTRARAKRINCVSNLKCTGLSFRQWALDNNDRFPTRVSVSTNGAMELAEQGEIWAVFQVMSNELNTPKILLCPADTVRTFAPSFRQRLANTNLSYFVGLDADETQPQMFLAGDDHWQIGGNPAAKGVVSIWTNTPIAWTTARHDQQGNVGLADGSVQGFTSARLWNASTYTGVPTNRLAFP